VLVEAKAEYVLGFQIYTGASSTTEDNASKGVAYRVVMKLTEPYQGKEHIDNFYTSLILVYDIHKKGTFLTGTMYTNYKQFPVKLKVDKKGKNILEIGNYCFATLRN